MLTSSRRTALLAIAAGSAALPVILASSRAIGQTAPAEGGDQSDYVTQTLALGSVSLQTSQIAVEKATNPMVMEFANLEAGEQMAVAAVLSSTEAGKAPPEPAAEDQAKVDELSGMEAGPEFDAAYIQGQIDAHNRLLEVQQTLSGETVATVEAVTAKLGEQAVMSHLAMLNHIQQQLGGASGGGTAGAAPAGAPASGDAAGSAAGGSATGGNAAGGSSAAGGAAGGGAAGGATAGGNAAGGASGNSAAPAADPAAAPKN